MNTIKTILIMGMLMALLIFVGGLLGGRQMAAVFFGIALVMNFVSYWFSDRIILTMYRAQEIGPGDYPRYYGIVQRLAERAGLPMPKVYIIPTQAPNAFATGRNPSHAAVAATQGILQTLDERELEGVMAHELAHIKHRDILTSTIVASIVGAISFLASMARWGFIFGGMRGNDRDGDGGAAIGMLVMAILAPLIAVVLQLWISRTREFAADRGGAEIAGQTRGLISALQKIEAYARHGHGIQAGPATAHMFIINPLRGGGFSKLFSTHPSTEERIQKLQEIGY